MTRHYTRQDKLRALTLLRASRGNLTLTSLHTGVPTRLLRKWSRERQRQKGIAHPEGRKQSRQRMMEDLFDLALAAEAERLS